MIILQAMSVAGAVILMVALLLVAGFIGVITTWYYAKSVYTPVIRKLEEEKEQLNLEIRNLKDDVTRLNGTIQDLNEKIAILEKDISGKEGEITALNKELLTRSDLIRNLENELKELKKR